MSGNLWMFSDKLDDEDIEILIKDTGCGISEEQLPTVFEPFVTYKKDGNGLGLSICKRIIEAHGGEITVTSSENVGTVFSILLKTNNINH